MIEEQATVVSVEAEHILVQTLRKSSCNSCSASKGCGTAVLSKAIGQKHSLVSVPKSEKSEPILSAGDEVIIGINEDMLLNGSLLAYMVPLAGMIGLALLASIFGASMGWGGELHIIAAAFTGVFAGILISRRIINKGRNKVDFAPVLVRKLQHFSAVRDNILLP